MTRTAGRLLVAIAAIHFFFGVWFGRNALLAIVTDGLWNAVDPHAGRQLVFWFLAFAVPIFLLGLLVSDLGARGHRAPDWLGVCLFVFALIVCLLMPLSGGWLLLVPAVLLFLDSRRRRQPEGSQSGEKKDPASLSWKR